MDNVVKLRPVPVNRINEVLDDAFSADYDEIIVVGITGIMVEIHHSDTISRTRLIGALEMAKHYLLTDD